MLYIGFMLGVVVTLTVIALWVYFYIRRHGGLIIEYTREVFDEKS